MQQLGLNRTKIAGVPKRAARAERARRHKPPRRATGASRRLCFFLPLLATVACAPGIAWRGYAYDPVAVAREQDRLNFVYFRSWYDPACTRFEDQVLRDPGVLNATRPLNCIVLEYAADEKLAKGWGLSKAPAFVVVTSGGDVLARGEGLMTAAELASALRDARMRFTSGPAPASSPASEPAAAP